MTFSHCSKTTLTHKKVKIGITQQESILSKVFLHLLTVGQKEAFIMNNTSLMDSCMNFIGEVMKNVSSIMNGKLMSIINLMSHTLDIIMSMDRLISNTKVNMFKYSDFLMVNMMNIQPILPMISNHKLSLKLGME